MFTSKEQTMEQYLSLRPATTKKIVLKVVQLVLVLLISFAWMRGMQSPTSVRAAAGNFFVDGASGADTPACGTTAAPCASLTYTLASRARAGDTLRVAQGTYTESITLNQSQTLEGGYEAENWTRDVQLYPTILDGSTTPFDQGSWDGFGVRYPFIIHDGSAYKMWYTGFSIDTIGSLGYATSSDGVTWNRRVNPVLKPGATGEWDGGGIEDATIIKEGSTYKMWYSAFQVNGPGQVGYATSSDGVHWTKYAGNPIITPGTETWNNSLVIHPHVLFFDSKYHLWALTGGDDGSGFSLYFAYASSDDGIAWDWSPGNPVLEREWEDWFWRPFVVQDGATYELWYSLSSGGQDHIGYATSPDGLSWTRQGIPALSGTPGMWDENMVNDPMVLLEGGSYSLWYDNHTFIGLATSPDGTTWTKSAANPVFGPGTPPNWGQPVVSVQNSDTVAVLDGFTITGGTGIEAGGVHGADAQVTIRNCTITGNLANGSPWSWGGGGVLSNGKLTIEDSQIVDNWVVQGASGVRVGDGTLTISNTVVANNTGDMAIHLNGSAQLTNVTVANNEGGILMNPQTAKTLNLLNTIVYGNGWQISVEGSGSSAVTYSLVEGGWPGTGNLNADPSFVDPDAGDYHLQFGSPAIDTATETGAPDHDLDGNHRPRDGDLDLIYKTDMGAYEFVPPYVYLPLITKE
jgi:predicted GH43/DUF377 family glycosyl hydrolase